MKAGVIQAIQKAKEIRKQFNSEGVSPFPFEKIESEYGDLNIRYLDINVDIDNTEIEKISGAISFDDKNSKYTIIVNTKKTRTRQYFTVAHELGHYFLHKELIKSEKIVIDSDGTLESSRTLFRLDNAPNTEVEVEANNFAAELIMPEELVIEAWKKLDGDIEECARIFNVSIIAMAVRLEKLDLVKE